MSRSIALTGGIASGKTAVSKKLAELGAVIVDSDVLAREVVEPGTPALAEIVQRFGSGILDASGRLDRPALGAVVFADPEARADLEAIVHPAIRQRATQLAASAPADAMVIQVIPLLFEKNLAADFDTVIVVDASVDTQRRRLGDREGLTRDEVEARLAAQATRTQRLAGADHVIHNDGSLDALESQVARLWRSLRPAAAKFLPVPELTQTLERYLRSVGPLLDEAARATTASAVAEFAASDGPALQSALLDFATQENAAGRSWLSEAWLDAYLDTRDPLPLSSNVGFQIRVDSERTGVARAAELLLRFAAVHLAHLSGALAPPVSPRGEPICEQQWRFLAGGVRHPQPVRDGIHPGPLHTTGREIGVLWRGSLFALPVTDAAGRIVREADVAAALDELTRSPVPDEGTFADLSYLGSQRAAMLLSELLVDPHNQQVYDRLTDLLFVVNLVDVGDDDEGHLRRTTFAPGQAWVYKPVTYQIGLRDDYLAMHVEHSIVDGATIKAVVAEAQQTAVPETESAFAAGLEPLRWCASSPQQAELSSSLGQYRAEADAHRIRLLRVPFGEPNERISHDAVQQWLLLVAQLASSGTVRSVYEAVDMREFQAGRTECLRPVTPEAVTLARHLLLGDATMDHVRDANRAHRDQVVACKTGQGVDRHLFGLALMARGGRPALFTDEGYQRLTTDFLSTTSVGDSEQIVRFGFAPTSAGGIGVNYTHVEDGYEFCLSYRADECPRIEEFVAQIQAAAEAMGQVLASGS